MLSQYTKFVSLLIHMRPLILLSVLVLGGSATSAQDHEAQAQKTAEQALESASDKEKADEKKPKEDPAPLALALDLAFGATVWAQVRLSTAGPVIELSRLVRQGYYKLEIIQLVLLSAEANKTLKQTLEKRKKGAKLAEITKDYRLDYDRIYEAALAIQELVDREYLPRFKEKPMRRPREDLWGP